MSSWVFEVSEIFFYFFNTFELWISLSIGFYYFIKYFEILSYIVIYFINWYFLYIPLVYYKFFKLLELLLSDGKQSFYSFLSFMHSSNIDFTEIIFKPGEGFSVFRVEFYFLLC